MRLKTKLFFALTFSMQSHLAFVNSYHCPKAHISCISIIVPLIRAFLLFNGRSLLISRHSTAKIYSTKIKDFRNP